MELKPGYKQTQVGVIPEDWEVAKLGEHVAFRTGPFGSALHKSDYIDDGVPVVNPMHIVDAQLIPTRTMTVTEVAARTLAEFRLRPGDVIIGRRGDMGRCAVVHEDQVGWLCGTGSMIIRCRDGLSPEFLQRVLSSPRVVAAIEDSSVGSTMTNLNQGVLVGLTIQRPGPDEQCAIAGALRDVDALLGALNRLIAKKRDLKQAAMQQLLTGETRLPGFNGEWVVRRLGDVFSISVGKSKSAYIVGGGRYTVMDMGSVSSDGRLIVSKATNFSGDFLKIGNLIMPKDDIGGGNIIGKVGYIDADNAYVLGDHVYCLTANQGDPLFLCYVINGHRTNTALRRKVIGSAQLGLSRRSVEEQEISFPIIEEQTAISTVLSDMDAEIAALEARLAKTRALKQGMMQELLTGKTRLV